MAATVTTEDKKPAARAKAPAKSQKATATKVAAETGSAKPAKPKSAAKAVSAKPVASRAAVAKVAKDKPASRAKAPENRQSRDTSMTGKEHDDHVERIWELAKRIGIAMFVTWDGTEQRARPLAAHVEKAENAIYFLTDVNGEKDDQIEEHPHVSVTFADHKHSKYVALAGRAVVLNDRAKIKDLWSPFAKAWWDSPEDPAIRVIKLTPADAELWDSPGRIVTTISMLAAAISGRSPKIGENAKVVL